MMIDTNPIIMNGLTIKSKGTDSQTDFYKVILNSMLSRKKSNFKYKTQVS